jgi:hypothetical protein
MRLRRMAWGSVLAVSLVAALFQATAIASALAADATGTWKWTFTRGDGQAVDVTMKLKQEGEKLTGTVTGPGGTEPEIKEGKVKDGVVTFKVDYERDGNTFTVKYSAKLDGDALNGKIEFEANGETRMRDFEANRTP